MLKRAFLFISMGLLMVFCTNKRGANIEQKIEMDSEGPVYSVGSDDMAMNLATEIAKRTLDSFERAYSSRNPDFENFELKVRFKTLNGGEHIWVRIIKLTGGEYYGVVNNTAESTREVKLGDTIHVNKQNISDWMYVEKNVLRGGYTIKALRRALSPAEKIEFDSSFDYKIPE